MVVLAINWAIIATCFIEMGKQVIWRSRRRCDIKSLRLRIRRGVGEAGGVRDRIGAVLARDLDPEPIAILGKHLRLVVVRLSNTDVLVELCVALEHQFARFGSRVRSSQY